MSVLNEKRCNNVNEATGCNSNNNAPKIENNLFKSLLFKFLQRKNSISCIVINDIRKKYAYILFNSLSL